MKRLTLKTVGFYTALVLFIVGLELYRYETTPEILKIIHYRGTKMIGQDTYVFNKGDR